MVRTAGVKVVVGPEVPQVGNPENVDTLLASFYNYPALPFPALVFDFGAVTVQGTYEQILQNVRNYKNVRKYLAVADGLQLTGTSPNMQGTYNLTVVSFIRGDKIAPAIASIQSGASGTANGQGGPGGFAGFGGGPGGPPRGFGGPGGPPAGIAGGGKGGPPIG